MAVVIEDGSGRSDAEVYHDHDFLRDFVAAWGLGDASTVDDDDLEPAMRRGTLLFDSIYGIRFAGSPLSGSQALVFPMTGLINRRSFELPVLPLQVLQASAILSWQEYRLPNSMFPAVTPGKTKKSITADKVSVEYDNTAGGLGFVTGARPILSIVESILSPILSVSTGGRTLWGSVDRG